MESIIPMPEKHVALKRLTLAITTSVAKLFAVFLACDTVVNQIVSQVSDSKRQVLISGYPITISVGVVIGSALIALVFFSISGATRTIYKRDLRRFFGFRSDYRALFVIPSYRCVGTETFGVEGLGHDAFYDKGNNLFYKRNETEELVPKKAFQDPICLSTDVAAYFFASRSVGPKGVEFFFAIDEKVVSPRRMNALTNLKTNTQTCYVCFGSESSNYLAKHLKKFAFFSTNPATYSFVGGDSLIRNGPERRKVARKGQINRLTSTPSDDYAVVSRYVDKGITFFLCAGIDQAGSIAATQILLRQWQTLLKETEGANFFYIYKIDRHHLRPEALYEETAEAKPLYKYVGKEVSA